MRSARRPSLVVVGLAGTTLGAAPASGADSGPVILVPGGLGAPVLINGVDVTGAVIEGSSALYRPQMVDPSIPAPVDVARRFFPGSYDPRKLWGYHLFPRLRPPAKSCRPPITRCRCRRRAIAAPGRPTSQQVPADFEPPAPPLLVAPQI
jgi:hypothetical protein